MSERIDFETLRKLVNDLEEQAHRERAQHSHTRVEQNRDRMRLADIWRLLDHVKCPWCGAEPRKKHATSCAMQKVRNCRY